MIIDERIVRALAQVVPAGDTHQRACLIGGQALRDLYAALKVRIGPDIPAVRASQDLDLLLSIGSDPAADRALHAALAAHWQLAPERPATYRWREDPAIELDLATTYDHGEAPARAVKISLAGTGRILAYRMIPRWLHDLNLMEPCQEVALRRLGLERLRQTALVVSKLLAIDACLQALALPEPPAWTARVVRDLDDVLYLSDRSLRPGLWCAACAAKRAELHRHIDPLVVRLTAWATIPPAGLSVTGRTRLLTVVDGLPLWWQ